MTQFVAPPPINEPITSDDSGKIKSPAWLRWLNDLADSISSGVTDDNQPTQSTLITGSVTTAAPDPSFDMSTESMHNYEVLTVTTSPVEQSPMAVSTLESQTSSTKIDESSLALFWNS